MPWVVSVATLRVTLPGLGLWTSVAACGVACETTNTTVDDICTLELEEEPPRPPLGPSEPTECDPLDQPAAELRIQPPVAVGEDDSGALYVLDRVGTESRIFTSVDGNTLKRLNGVPSSADYLRDFTYYSFWTLEPPLQGIVKVPGEQRQPGHILPNETTFVLFRPPNQIEGELADAVEHGEALRMKSECAVASLRVENLQNRPLLEYSASDDEGNVIVVATPNDFQFDDYFYVFYGPPDAVRQRQPKYFARKKDGGTTTVGFFLNASESAEVLFPVGCDGALSEPCAGVLTLPDGRQIGVSPWSEDVKSLEGKTFICGI